MHIRNACPCACCVSTGHLLVAVVVANDVVDAVAVVAVEVVVAASSSRNNRWRWVMVAVVVCFLVCFTD